MILFIINLTNDFIFIKGAGLIGGPGLIPGCNIGREFAMFEPVSF